METKTYIISGIGSVFLLAASITVGYTSCINAGNEESRYNNEVRVAATRWLSGQPQMQLVPSSIMCIPRSFGSRMPDDLTHCRALTSANYRVALMCNMQGCTIDHSDYRF